MYVAFKAALRRELKAADTEATLPNEGDGEWTRFRDAQTARVNSLENSAKSLIEDVAKRSADLDQQRAERFEKLEAELREALNRESEKLKSEFDAKETDLATRDKALADKAKAFDTKEARYVAREKQTKQIDEVKEWLKKWDLTKGTTSKRRWVEVAYFVGIVASGCFAAYSIYHGYDLLKSSDDLAKLVWWQWLALASKTVLPLAVFTSFLVYYIRWQSAWARQHAEEEFRYRTLLIDIGRAGWLIEAVRDARESNQDLPADLWKQLSRNLFSHSPQSERDEYPKAISDILMQGLSSIRVKSPDGSEVEASSDRANKKGA